MAGSSNELHEDGLSEATIDRHRAIVSLMEELEAVDWYDQRIEGTSDETLAAILIHNRDEEKEHAAMVLEWLRRHDDSLDKELRTYLFTDGPILETESIAMGRSGGAPAPSSGGESGAGLGIGSLSGRSSL